MIKQLQLIQSELKAPKGQRNTFGNYSYRSCEDILEALKPVLANHDATITLSDEIVLIGERYYVKATATLTIQVGTKSQTFTTTAYAREAAMRKGMDESQITGSASSYARKYALSGLFALDDTKDADTMDNRQQTPEKAQTPVADKLVIARVKKCKTPTELNNLWHKLQEELGDSFADVKSVYTVVFAQRKAELANANN
jgi:hypothetical protein